MQTVFACNDNWIEYPFPIQIPKYGAKIKVLVDQKHDNYCIQLLNSYFSAAQIQVINFTKNAITSYDADLLIFFISSQASYIKTNPELTPGEFSIQTKKFSQKPALVIHGGDSAGLIYAIHELGKNQITYSDAVIEIPALNITQTPALPYRLFWTWDHSTNWYLTQNGQQDIGFANPYLKPEESFLEDYRRLIDFMSLHRINGVTIYGFLRDSHGGIAAAQEICRYAKERGVRILPGVGINCYGGIYWEGNHRYNLTHWLRANPELRAKFDPLRIFELPEFAKLHIPETHYLDAACPSKSENHQYHVEAIQWLTETFDIGGINFETGDYGACQCKDCQNRRKVNHQWSLEDMALLYPRLFAAARAGNKKDLWLVCESYWDNLLDLDKLAPLANLPDDAIYQFCINRSYWYQLETALTREHIQRLPRSTNILRTHMGSQWQMERYQLVAQRFANMMRLAHMTGMKGATIFAESSAFNTVNEINYLAFARFGYDAHLTWETFVANDLGPLFGGSEAAQQYLALLTQDGSTQAITNALGLAREFANMTSGETYRRWLWLQNYLWQKKTMLH